MNEIINIIARELNIDAENISADSYLIEDLGADELDLISIIVGIEEWFEAEIPDSELEYPKDINVAGLFDMMLKS